MTNHHKLLFLQNSDIPNHLSADVTGGAQTTPLVEAWSKLANLKIPPKNHDQNRKIADPSELFYKRVWGFITAVKHLMVSLAIEWTLLIVPLFSQSISLSLKSLRFHLTKGTDIRFLDTFSDGFRCRISRQISMTDFLRTVAIHRRRIDL